MFHLDIDIEKLDYSKPISYYAKFYGVSHQTIKKRFQKLGIYTKFYYTSGENTGKLKCQKAKEEYAQNPKKCKHCLGLLDYNQRKYTFCSTKCSTSFSYLENPDRKTKQSELIKTKIEKGEWKPIIPHNSNPRIERIAMCCEFCQKEFEIYPIQKGKRRFCSKKCANNGYNAKSGGYREGSGTGKTGWYKGYYCASSWELAWVIYNLDHGLAFSKNKQGFSYIFENKNYKYYPDYILPDGAYLEIKGYKTPRWEAKLKHFPHKIHVFYKDDMEYILNYVTEKYGKNFIELYEGNPHNQKNNKCEMCGGPCKNKCCSKVCAGKRAKKLYNTKHNII